MKVICGVIRKVVPIDNAALMSTVLRYLFTQNEDKTISMVINFNIFSHFNTNQKPFANNTCN